MILLQKQWYLFRKINLNPSFQILIYYFNFFTMSTFFYYGVLIINGKSFSTRAIKGSVLCLFPSISAILSRIDL